MQSTSLGYPSVVICECTNTQASLHYDVITVTAYFIIDLNRSAQQHCILYCCCHSNNILILTFRHSQNS